MSDRPWLQLLSKGNPNNIEYDEKPIHAFLKEAAEKNPNKVSIHFMGKNLLLKKYMNPR